MSFNKPTVILLALVAGLALALWGITAAYTYQLRETKRVRDSWTASVEDLRLIQRMDMQMYQKRIENLTADEYRALYPEQYQKIYKDARLAAISQITTVTGHSQHNATVAMRDTTLPDTTRAKTFTFTTPSIQIKGIQVRPDSLSLQIRQVIDLTITISKQRREGLKKLFIWQRRPEVVTVIPSDTAIKINHVKLVKIK